MTITRRSLLAAGGSMLAVGASVAQEPVRLRGTVDIAEAKLKVAIPPFFGPDAQMSAAFRQVIVNNLTACGLFEVLDPQGFIQTLASADEQPRYQDWQAVDAKALLVGGVTRTSDGRVEAMYRAYDVLMRQPYGGQGLRTSGPLWRRLAHQISDRLYEATMREKGYFDTQIVFVDETGPKERRVKRLAIMDQDGFGPRMLTDGRDLALTPRFSPTQQQICFITYVNQQPRVALMNFENGQRDSLGLLPGLTYAPRFSPDGQRLVFSQQEGSGTALVEMELRTKQMRRFTQSKGIDTSPSYAPDGRALVFESDREGTQQLYVFDLQNGGVQRISRGEGRYSTPVWSPRGDYIAFTKQVSGQFGIGVMKIDGSDERTLSSDVHSEGPTWSPNGRVLMFFREGQGAQGGPKLISVDVTGRNMRTVPTPAYASDPAWGPLRA